MSILLCSRSCFKLFSASCAFSTLNMTIKFRTKRDRVSFSRFLASARASFRKWVIIPDKRPGISGWSCSAYSLTTSGIIRGPSSIRKLKPSRSESSPSLKNALTALDVNDGSLNLEMDHLAIDLTFSSFFFFWWVENIFSICSKREKSGGSKQSSPMCSNLSA